MTTPSDGSHEKAQHAPRPLAALRWSCALGKYALSLQPWLPPLSGVLFVPDWAPTARSARERPTQGDNGMVADRTCPCLTSHLIRVGVPQGLVPRTFRPQPGNPQREVSWRRNKRSPILGTEPATSKIKQGTGSEGWSGLLRVEMSEVQRRPIKRV